MNDPIILVCIPVRSMHDPITGATIIRCTRCDEPCWLAPSSVPALSSVTVVCSPCAFADTQVLMRDFGGFLPGQLEELIRELKDTTDITLQ